jgi:hypothetical protein
MLTRRAAPVLAGAAHGGGGRAGAPPNRVMRAPSWSFDGPPYTPSRRLSSAVCLRATGIV